MGRDFRHRGSNLEKFEDGFGSFKNKKLDSYDRNKSRKKNKFNLNHFDIVTEPEDELELYIDEEEE